MPIRNSPHRLLALLALACSLRVAAAEPVRFNRDVRPIMSETCFHCHGPATQRAGLRLDVRDRALAPLESKAIAIVPGKPDASEAIRRVFADDEDLMPPAKSHKTLTAAQKALLKRWVTEGATYEKHWSFEPPQKAEARNSADKAIDAFITDRLGREGLAMSREADRPTLIRRAAFALTGLPPSLAELDAFEGDRSPGAYERMVDRYLASPRFGEEMARNWLDVARYGDTHGLHLDNERQMWAYRDWVVHAFNANKPFDQFVIEQVAGDLIPGASTDQVVGTGFLRCGVTTGEGGSITEENLYRYAVERTNAVAEAFLGLTAGCAVCHDHKFDPISAKEYYSLYAFFNSAADPAMDGNAILTAPTLRLATPEQDKRVAELEKQLAAAQKKLDERLAGIKYAEPTPTTRLAAATKPAKAGAKLDRADDPQYSFATWWKQGVGKDTPNLDKDLNSTRKAGPAKRPAADKEKKLRDYYLLNVFAETKAKFEPAVKELASLKKERDDLDKSIPQTFVFRDADKPRQSFVMTRGQYNKPGDKVDPNVPAILPPLSRERSERATRLDLAKWLVSNQNPLTARVAVNRLWQQFFGTGLVKTSNDFGSQGEVPSHPELLDYLAVDFREHGWDVKRLARQLLCSQAFRQDAAATPELLTRDPANRLFARGPRVRLDAEQIRDNALFVSGLINLEMGGRGARPYQPPNIWEPVAYTGSNTRSYTPDKGPALYRRSVYCFLKRTAPPPYMSNFDGPSREAACARRERSNTPLQALQLMNDMQHFEAARALAERMLTEGGATADGRLDFAYRVVLGRRPDAGERAVLAEALGKFSERYAQDPAAAKLAIRHGDSTPKAGLNESELAAYTLLANLILNLDETLNRN
jgi:hypothetical protein